MSNKPNNTETTSNIPTLSEESKDRNQHYNLSKFEYDLYHEEDDIAEKVIRVKRVSLPNKGERWKVFSDNKIIFTIEGNKLSKKEKEFLQTIDGVNFILTHAKSGFTSFNKFRVELKNKVDNKLSDKVTSTAVQKPVKRTKKPRKSASKTNK